MFDERGVLTRFRFSRAALVLVGLTTALAVAPMSGLAASTGAAKAIPDVTVLFGRAVKMVRSTKRPTYAHAVVFEADGRTRGGRGTKSASGIVSWRFVLDNQSSGSRFRSATIFYGPPPKAFGKVRGQVSPFLEDLDIRRAPRMTLSQAVTRLQRSRYRKAFVDVTLRNPLGPKASNPLYIFGFTNNTFVAVDTVTRKVVPLR